MLDLDNFKYVNDAFGHRAGDELLRSVGSLLPRRSREGEVLARLGGDEFAVLLPAARRSDAAARTAIRLLEALRGHVLPIDGRPIGVTASIGIACFGDDGRSGEELLADADRAMYLAKDGGRDRAMTVTRRRPRAARRDAASAGSTGSARRSSATCSSSTASRSWTCAAARSPSTSCCCGWSGDDELVAPGAFLGVAERLGLIHAIDRWVVAEALRLLAERPTCGSRSTSRRSRSTTASCST